MCLFITILALACAWNIDLMSTKEEGRTEERTTNLVSKFLVQFMCLFITILALACAWNIELMSTKEEGKTKERTRK